MKQFGHFAHYVYQIKCKKCNGSISSVRFLAATASRSTFNEDDEHDYCCEYSAASASASAKAVVGGSSDLTNVSSGGVNSVNYPQLYHSKPVKLQITLKHTVLVVLVVQDNSR